MLANNGRDHLAHGEANRSVNPLIEQARQVAGRELTQEEKEEYYLLEANQ